MQLATHSQPGFSLVIERGQTRFPERPVNSERFLIGAGSNCQLQLGGEVPILHSIIVPQDDHLWIDAVVASPPLMVNGRLVRESQLHPGDIIEIAGFVFCVSRPSKPFAPAVAEEAPAPRTAEQLVDALAVEMEQLEELQQQRERGARALLQAARMAGQPQSKAAVPSEPSLDGLVAQLKARAADLDAREAALVAHAQQLEETQQRLQQQLEELLAARRGDDDSPSLRMTA